MKDPRDNGHTPGEAYSSCECCSEYECSECGEPWPCGAVSEYDEKVAMRERRKALPDELDKLTERVNALELDLTRANAQLRYQQAFIFGAALPVIRDLLATHATGKLTIPAPTWAIDARNNPRAVESGTGVGVNFRAAGGYEYESTDGRVYTDGRVTRGAKVEKVGEQLRRMGQ